MKLKVQFGREARFDIPIRCRTLSQALWLPCVRVLMRVLALARRPKLIKPELASGISPEGSSQ